MPPSRTPASGAPASGAPTQGPSSTKPHVSEQRCVRDCPSGQPVVAVRVSPGTHAPVSPAQAPDVSHAHEATQRSRRVPQRPHAAVRVVPGAQTPSPSHAPYSQTPALLQKRSCPPHIPHVVRSSAPGRGQPSDTQSDAGANTHASEQSSSRVAPAAQPALVRVRGIPEGVELAGVEPEEVLATPLAR